MMSSTGTGETIFDTGDLVAIFGLPTDLSDEGGKIYWFRYERNDGASIVVNFSAYDRIAGVIVRCGDRISSSVELSDCQIIRVLDPVRKVLEIVTGGGARCLLALDVETVLNVRAS